MEVLYLNLMNLQLNQVIMWVIGGTLIYLAIAKEMEPTLKAPVFSTFWILCLPSVSRVQSCFP